MPAVSESVARKSTDIAIGVDLDAPADILVSEILSSSVLSEHVFTSFEHAICQSAQGVVRAAAVESSLANQ